MLAFVQQSFRLKKKKKKRQKPDPKTLALDSMSRRVSTIDESFGVDALFGAKGATSSSEEEDDGGMSREKVWQAAANSEKFADFCASTKNRALSTLVSSAAKGEKQQDLKTLDAFFAETCGRGRRREATTLTRGEWVAFLRSVALERRKYLTYQGLLAQRCFWGRTSKTVTGSSSVLRLCRYLFEARTPPGYAFDLAYYVENHHPFFSACYRDANHPLTRFQKVLSLLLQHSYVLAASATLSDMIIPKNLGRRNLASALHPFRAAHFSTAVETATSYAALVILCSPMLFLQPLCFYLLACPCFKLEKRGRRAESWIGSSLSCTQLLLHALVTGLVGLLLAYTASETKGAANGLAVVVLYVIGLTFVYALWPIQLLLCQFNLAKRGRAFSFLCRCCLFAPVSCGRWLRERSEVLSVSSINPDDYSDTDSENSDDDDDDDNEHTKDAPEAPRRWFGRSNDQAKVRPATPKPKKEENLKWTTCLEEFEELP